MTQINPATILTVVDWLLIAACLFTVWLAARFLFEAPLEAVLRELLPIAIAVAMLVLARFIWFMHNQLGQ